MLTTDVGVPTHRPNQVEVAKVQTGGGAAVGLCGSSLIYEGTLVPK
jgi:hypothetical protein